jgi:hypothetical protein
MIKVGDLKVLEKRNKSNTINPAMRQISLFRTLLSGELFSRENTTPNFSD